MIQINIWMSNRGDSFKYAGKRYTLKSRYSVLKKKMDTLETIVILFLWIISYFCAPKGIFVYVGCGSVLAMHLLLLPVYIAKFPNSLDKLI